MLPFMLAYNTVAIQVVSAQDVHEEQKFQAVNLFKNHVCWKKATQHFQRAVA